MANCCEDKGCEIATLRENHARVLWIVLAINAVMFVVEGAAGLLAHSTSLLADALDMLGDALVYGFSLFVLGRSVRWQAGAALAKGAFMLLFGLAVLSEAADKVLHPVMPTVAAMGVVGGVALTANLVCFFANVAVLAAAAGGFLLASRWPDIVVGALIASLFIASALGVLRQSVQTLMASPVPSQDAGAVVVVLSKMR
jgi:Co/Zn/Cd efflux system component